MVEAPRALFIPVILGTVRQGRMSPPVARLVASELSRRPGIETELIDVARIALRLDDAGEATKDPTFASQMNRADALVVVSPEYNHGYSGLLKHVLDGCLKEYIHQAVGVVGVSAGPFGGTRGIQDLLPVLRELGLVSIFWDVNFSNVQSLFDLGVMHVDGSEPDDLPELWRRDESPCGEVGPSDRPGRRGVHGPGAGRDGRGAAHLSGMRDVRLAASEQWR